LSLKLLRNIVECLPELNAHVVSIGCGTGLLEAHLQHKESELKVEGVEVASCTVKYLPIERIHVVAGTRDVCSIAAIANAWLFVYPRKPSLISTYLEAYQDASVEVVLWIGPQADWDDIRRVFLKSPFCRFMEIESSGLASYEKMVSITRGERRCSVTPPSRHYSATGYCQYSVTDIDDI
jgi:hypothetical protein